MNDYRYIRGSDKQRESVEFTLPTTENEKATVCTVNVDMLLCGVKKAKCDDFEDITLTTRQTVDILRLVAEEREKIITAISPKSNESWHESGLNDFGEYFRIGDEVTEELVDYFTDLLPPAYMGFGMLQVGEPHSHEKDPETGKFRATYTTFIKSGGKWKYVGECFYKQETNRVARSNRLARALEEAEKLLGKERAI